MRVLIISLCLLVFCGIVYADDPVSVPSLDLPDMQAGMIYSAKKGDFEGAVTATVLSYPTKVGDIELRAGYAMESEPIGAACFKLGDLSQFGFEQPLHNIINVSAGPYIGYDFNEEEFDYGAIVTVIQVSF